MTATKVVDASALAALLFGEPEAETVAVRLDGARLVAPSLLRRAVQASIRKNWRQLSPQGANAEQ